MAAGKQLSHTDYKLCITQYAIWHMADEHEEAIIKSLETDSDRAVAIIAASMVEARLDGLLLMLFQRNKMVEERMFQPSGPLGSFSSKIDLAFLLNVISRNAHTQLVKIKDVRNLFAHKLNIQGFESPAIRDRIKHLTFVDTHIAQGSRKPHSKVLSLEKPVEVPFMWLDKYDGTKLEPRRRYLMACSIFVSAFMGLRLRKWLEGGVRPIL